MRRLVPDPQDEELNELYTDLSFPAPPAGRPWVFLDMVASVDGAATVSGRTGALGGEADGLAFSRLREWCDVVLVGASTVRVEDYGPPRPRAEARQRRTERGLQPVPRLAVVTASGVLDARSRLFAEAHRPLVIVPEDVEPARVAHLEESAELRRHGAGGVADLAAAFAALAEEGVVRILCEGGPTLNRYLIEHSLVDEIFLTISPQLVGASAHRIVEGLIPQAPLAVELVELREHRGELLTRYRIA